MSDLEMLRRLQMFFDGSVAFSAADVVLQTGLPVDDAVAVYEAIQALRAKRF